MKVYILEIKASDDYKLKDLCKALKIDEEDLVHALFDYTGSVPSYKVCYDDLVSFVHTELSCITTNSENPINTLKEQLTNSLHHLMFSDKGALSIEDDCIKCKLYSESAHLPKIKQWHFKTEDTFTPEVKSNDFDTRRYDIMTQNIPEALSARNEVKNTKIIDSEVKQTYSDDGMIEVESMKDIFHLIEKIFLCELISSKATYSSRYMKSTDERNTRIFLYDTKPHIHQDKYLIENTEIDRARDNHKLGKKTTFIYHDDNTKIVKYVSYTPFIHYYVEGPHCMIPMNELISI